MNPPVPSVRIQELQRQIDELKKSWPAHSVPAAMLQQLEELEEELEMERKKFGG
ncbi:MAG: histidine kinase [Chloroflexi bacterium]|nr:MAG: histidine kinase [Chloroflexota bacterium]